MSRRSLRIFYDGGCRPNPGPIEAAVVARGRVYFHDGLGHGSNTEAEWLALLKALELALELGAERFELIGDSQGVVDQASGAARSNGASAPLCARFAELATRAPRFRLRRVGRHQNLAGIALAARHER